MGSLEEGCIGYCDCGEEGEGWSGQRWGRVTVGGGGGVEWAEVGESDCGEEGEGWSV